MTGRERKVEQEKGYEMTRSISEWVTAAYENSKAHGWWDGIERGSPKVVPEKLVLIHSEVSEALEVVRENNGGAALNASRYVVAGDPKSKPVGLDSELADIFIRVGDLSGHLKVDLAVLLNNSFACDTSSLTRAVETVSPRRVEEFRDATLSMARIHLATSHAFERFQCNGAYKAYLADIVAHTFVLARGLSVDFERAVDEKHTFNVTRPFRHGGKTC